MPSHKPSRTYSRKPKSIDAVNALFAVNLTKRLKTRKRTKIAIRELPPRTRKYFSDSSLKVKAEDTFDRIVKAPVYNPIKLCSTKSENSSVPILKSSEHITQSLSVEIVKRDFNYPSLSYIKLPKITNDVSVSARQLFTETFREQLAVHSSTPCVPEIKKKLINDVISPISLDVDRLIEKSYIEIEKWDQEFPTFDWKLKQSPRVVLNNVKIEDKSVFSPIMTRSRRQGKKLEFTSFHNVPELSIITISDNLSDIQTTDIEDKIIEPSVELLQTPKLFKAKTGKSYRRSLSCFRRSSVILGLEPVKLCVVNKRVSVIVPANRRTDRCTLLEEYARGYVQKEVSNDEVEDSNIDKLDESVRSLSINVADIFTAQQQQPTSITACDIVLRKCGQNEIYNFEECYPRQLLQNCQKIGEGVYGEVFLYRNREGGTTVMKVIPIEGDLIVNGDRQKTFEQILSEIVIALELSNLRTNQNNQTYGFSQVQSVKCTKGAYPERLLELWDLYDEVKGSENDNPQVFPSNQIYIVLELANGGQDLESFLFTNASQAFSVFKQAAFALAVAEAELKFEHRDLHWGNILITNIDKKKNVSFSLNDNIIEFASGGVEVVIIDFTLSRIEADGVILYNDLADDDDLFAAEGDNQFEVYRLMQKNNQNNWQDFQPYSNLLWLHYLLDKSINMLRYKNKKTNIHKEHLRLLKKLMSEILDYESCIDFVTDKLIKIDQM